MTGRSVRAGFCAVTMTLGPGSLQAEDLRVPILGAASNFQFGEAAGKRAGLSARGIDALRDGLRWPDVEKARGEFRFDHASGARIAGLVDAGLLGSVTIHPQNPLYDDGRTVTSAAGIAAFARYAAAVADRFPGIGIEVANEFNGRSFVTGAAREMSALERADLYARIMQAIAGTGRVPPHRIIGGAAHSIPGAFLERVVAQTGPVFDALALHPYSSRPEALPAQIAALRSLPGLSGLEVEITEFGHSAENDASLAADRFWKGLCAASQAGIRRLVWYPLERRRDGYVPVQERDGRLTGVGRAFLHAKPLEGARVTRLWPGDSRIMGCRFGPRLAVIWGAPRQVSPQRPDLVLRGADMRKVARASLSRRQVLVVTVDETAPPLQGETDLALGPSPLLADTVDAYRLHRDPGAAFEPVLERRGRILPFTTCPGQERSGVPWVPYLCSDAVRRVVLTDRDFVLGGSAEAPVSILFRYRADKSLTIQPRAEFAIREASADGVVLSVLLNGAEIRRMAIAGEMSLAPQPFGVEPGDVVALRIDPGETVRGDAGRFRLGLYDADALAAGDPTE